MSRLTGQVAIVTGASRGIGLAIAERLVADGATVVITGRQPEPLTVAVEALGGYEHAIGVAGNAADPDHQDEVIATAIERFGGAHLLVNNIGINPVYGPLMDIDLDVARKIVDVNCVAALSWVQKAHHAWLGKHGGAVVNVASAGGPRPAPASPSMVPARRC